MPRPLELAPDDSDRCRFCGQVVCADCGGCRYDGHTECFPCCCEEPSREDFVSTDCNCCGLDVEDCICEYDINGFGWEW